jgi:hypothetical protein
MCVWEGRGAGEGPRCDARREGREGDHYATITMFRGMMKCIRSLGLKRIKVSCDGTCHGNKDWRWLKPSTILLTGIVTM